MAMGNSPSLVVSNMFMEHFEEVALVTADNKPTKWLRYVDDTFVIWPRGPARLQKFLHSLNSVRPTIKFTMEVETNDTFPFLHILIIKRGPKLATKVYWKPAHTGYLLSALQVQAPMSREKGSCSEFEHSSQGQDQKDFNKEIKIIRNGLILNEYPQEFVYSIVKPLRSNHPSSETIHQGTATIPYIKGISKNFRCIANRFNARTIFKTKRTPPDTDESWTN
jgi:hypothetical protein